jgi:hypothetical protein
MTTARLRRPFLKLTHLLYKKGKAIPVTGSEGP